MNDNTCVVSRGPLLREGLEPQRLSPVAVNKIVL